MSPHSDDFHNFVFFNYFINESVLDINSAGTGAGKVANEFLKWWWSLKRIFDYYVYKSFDLRPQP